MKIIKENNFSGIFPMKITCKRVVDEYGFAYGKREDFCGSELEVDADDIKKHKWSKYPDYSGIDYGVICPICGQFITIDESKIPKCVIDKVEEIFIS